MHACACGRAARFVIVLSGEIEMTVMAADGKAQLLSRLKPGGGAQS
jgi:CRP-like cAMP-binding protein